MELNKFKIRRTFNLKNRGLILCGEILEGRVKNGDAILVDGLKDKLKIQAVEYVDFSNGNFEVGLIIGNQEAELLNGIILNDLEIIIHHGNTE